MEIRNLKTFIEVAERKNFTQAAEALNYTQSTVSSQIKQLEDELGVQLFERIYHNVALTERGYVILKYAHQIMNMTEEMQNSSNDMTEIGGYVRLAMAPSVCNLMMGKTYMNFHNMYPNIEVKIIEAETNEMLQLLNHNDADAVFIVDRHAFNKDYVVAAEKKIKMHFVVGCNFDIDSEISIEELCSLPLILTEKGVSYRKILDEYLAEHNLEITPFLEMGNTHLLLELVELGVGVSFLPDYVTQNAYNEGRVKYINVNNLEIDIWRQLLYHKNKWISPAMKKVVEYCSNISLNT